MQAVDSGEHGGKESPFLLWSLQTTYMAGNFDVLVQGSEDVQAPHLQLDPDGVIRHRYVGGHLSLTEATVDNVASDEIASADPNTIGNVSSVYAEIPGSGDNKRPQAVLKLPQWFKIIRHTICLGSGDLRFESARAEQVIIKASAGDVALKGVIADKLNVETVDSAVTADHLRVDDLRIITNTGYIILVNSVADRWSVTAHSNHLITRDVRGTRL